MLSRVGAALKGALRSRRPPQGSSSGSGSTARPPGTSSQLHNGAAALNAPTTARTKSNSLASDSTRTLLWRLLNQLLVPEARTVLVLRHRLSNPSHLNELIARGLTRAIHATNSFTFAAANPRRVIGYSQSLSLPSRIALRPFPHQPRAFGAPQYLPRGPHTTNNSPRGPHAVARIGLGTARNFSSGRPVFQNLVQNVPVVARALNEAGDSIDDVKKKMSVTMMKRATAPPVVGSSSAKNRSIRMRSNVGGLRAQDGKNADRYDVLPTHESTISVSSSPCLGKGNAHHKGASGPSYEGPSDLQGSKKLTNGSARQAVNHGTVKSTLDRCRNENDMSVTDFDHYFALNQFPNRDPHHHLKCETSKRLVGPVQDPEYYSADSHHGDRCPGRSTTKTQRRPDHPAPEGTAFAPDDPFVTTLAIPLAPPAPPRRPLPSYVHVHEPFQVSGNPHDAYAEHATRVTSLFAFLDEQDVWARGATCDAFGVSGPTSLGDAHVRNNSVYNGLPVRVLHVRFEGWSEESVRQLLGPHSTRHTKLGSDVLDWCEVSSEPRHREVVTENQATSLGATFIMPTLDFSSAFSETVAASLQHQPQTHSHRHPNQPGEPSPWSSYPTPFEAPELDTMLSNATNPSFSRRDSLDFEFFPDQVSSTGTGDDAFEASDEMDLEDDEDEEGSESWFPSSSSPSVSSSRSGTLGRMNESFINVHAPPMRGPRIAFSSSFAERIT